MPSNSSIDAGHYHERQFPNEIIDEIIDYLQDNKKELKAVSLSSHIFLHRARKHLFATFVLDPINIIGKDNSVSSLPSRKIFGLVTSAPHLISYIQILKVGNPEPGDRLNTDKGFSKALGLFQQMLETEIASSSLRHFYLYSIVWCHLSADIQAAIKRLLGFKSLKRVTFHSTFDLPWTIFKAISPTVTALILSHVHFWPPVTKIQPGETDDEWCEDDIGPPGDSTQALLIKESGIDKVCIDILSNEDGTLVNDPNGIIFAYDSVFPLNVTHLRTCWAKVLSAYSWRKYQQFISHTSRSLETLGINFSFLHDNYNVPLPSLDCCQLDNLKRLHVRTSYTHADLALQSAFLWLCESLETLPCQHQLQSIIIRCVMGVRECIGYRSNGGSWPEVKKGLGWEHIDRFLAQPKFDSLRQIHVCLGVGSEVRRLDCNGVLRFVPVLLPRMIAKGIVVLDNNGYKEWKEPWPPH